MKKMFNDIILSYPDVFNTKDKEYTETEAIRLISSCVSQGSQLQKTVFDLRDSYNAICKLTDIGFRKYAAPLAEEIFHRLKHYQLYSQAYDVSSRLMYHHYMVGEVSKAERYEKHTFELADVLMFENKAKASYLKIIAKEATFQEIEIEPLLEMVESLKSRLPMDSVWYHYFYYKLKALTLVGDKLEQLYKEAIDYYENLYFDHSSHKSIFVKLLIKYYISKDSYIEASSMLKHRLVRYIKGSGSWFRFKFLSAELYRDQHDYVSALNELNDSKSHDKYKSQPDDFLIQWDALYKDVKSKAEQQLSAQSGRKRRTP